MPHIPPRGCSISGCREKAERGSSYCKAHKKTERDRYNRFERGYKTEERYGTDWRRIRARYASDHPLCEECLKSGRYVPVQEVHHIVPLSSGGGNDEMNLVSLCRSCHQKAHIAIGDR